MIYAYSQRSGFMAFQGSPKKPTNLSLDQDLSNEAKALGVNLSQAAEAGLRQAVIEAKSRIWKDENADALKSSCDWVEQHGLPLSRFRQF
jgi:antitoxin CcdA